MSARDDKLSLEAEGTRCNGRFARRRRVGRRILIALAIVAGVAILWNVPVRDMAAEIERWSRDLGAWGAAVFVAAFILLTILSVPVWPLPFVAGALYGPWKGAALASASIVLASAASFGVARMARRAPLGLYLEGSHRMQALDEMVRDDGWKVVAAVRLSHFLSFGLQNYAFGLTSIRLGPFLTTTWLVTLPGTVLQAYVGSLGFSGLQDWQSAGASDGQAWGLRLGGLAMIASAVAYLGRLMRSVYRRSLDIESTRTSTS